ncbi:SDR family NAD(P)-dependent oxidoreductase [Microbacterium sp. YJN-G]|uniref:SDR family NAD(P)-dependent oxidoreductase n=1 Tax=Microbacterium sp. YJN-G TaxID=2763257 RepID=UPI001877C658|nr:SDR family oxidoreductase [Microbacterium sp. YJN-G]
MRTDGRRSDSSDEGLDASRPVAVVTGAAAGIGLAIAERLLADGFAVGVFDRDAALKTRFAAAEAAGRATVVVGDVTDAADRARLIEAVAAAHGGVDVLVNNAGIGGFGERIGSLDLAHLRTTLEINTVSVAAFVQLALPHLQRSERARIVNIGSLFADDPAEGGTDYTLSKGAIHALTRILAVELGPAGITCNSIAPGYILTEMHRAEVALQASRLGIAVEERFAQLRAQVPLRRHGTAEDIAGAVSWLASTDSAYVTGVRIAVNGGVSFA